MNLTYRDPSHLSQDLSTNVQQGFYAKLKVHFPVIMKKKKGAGSLQKVTKPLLQQDTVSKDAWKRIFSGVGLQARITAYSSESGTFQTA